MSKFKTPLRYPGGKQKLAPFVREIIVLNNLTGGHYVEPYAGGAGVALDLLFDDSVSHIHLNDSCTGIYAFWRAILDHAEQFCRRISTASLTVEEWRRHQNIVNNRNQGDILDVGFSTFYLNRCNRSGILSGGLIGGLKQEGQWKMDARFPRNELIRRIEAIATKRDAISITNLDAEDFLVNNVPSFPDKTFIYCDPPYFKKAKKLYLDHYKPEDHARISKVIQENVARPWIVSYDAEAEIIENYSDRRFFLYDLRYTASTQYIGSEVFFFCDDLTIPQRSSLPFIDQALVQTALA